MAPRLDDLQQLGGSHAQRDVLVQLCLDAAVKAGRADAARAVLEREAARHPVPPARRVGYAEAASRFLD
jgi:hypothetical protein